MPNSNCLAGFKCPKCGSEDRFDISAESIFTMTDDGEDEHFDVEWGSDSYCRCRSCDLAGTVKEFREEEAQEPDGNVRCHEIITGYEFIVVECDMCHFHLGLDAKYLEQKGPINMKCPCCKVDIRVAGIE